MDKIGIILVNIMGLIVGVVVILVLFAFLLILMGIFQPNLKGMKQMMVIFLMSGIGVVVFFALWTYSMIFFGIPGLLLGLIPIFILTIYMIYVIDEEKFGGLS